MQGHIYRKKSSDGSWSRWYAVIDHPGVDGKRRQKTSTHETKRDAQAWLAQVVQELRAGQVYDTTVTVQEYLTSWLAGKQSLPGCRKGRWAGPLTWGFVLASPAWRV